MPQTVTSVDLLQQYIRGVMDRAEHHAGRVDEICLSIAGAIVRRKEGELEVMARDGKMKNVLWLRVNGQRYAMSYNHNSGLIEVRQGTTRGNVLAAFDNTTSIQSVKDFFGNL